MIYLLLAITNNSTT